MDASCAPLPANLLGQLAGSTGGADMGMVNTSVPPGVGGLSVSDAFGGTLDPSSSSDEGKIKKRGASAA